MEKNLLSKFNLCDPEKCPLADNCPDGPMPGAPCGMKQEFTKYLDQGIHDTFALLTTSPETELRVNMLLKPLFEQLLRLRIAELNVKQVFSGKSVNPIFRELRGCITAINNVLTESIKSYKEDTGEKVPPGPGSGLPTGKGYYEMLVYDGQASVENRVGPD